MPPRLTPIITAAALAAASIAGAGCATDKAIKKDANSAVRKADKATSKGDAKKAVQKVKNAVNKKH